MEIKNTTLYTKELNGKFQRLHYKRNVLIFQIIFSAVLLILSIVCFPAKDLEFGFTLLGLAIFYNLLIYVLLKIKTARINKSNTMLNTVTTITYTFTEENINITARSSDTSGTQTIPYGNIFLTLISPSLILLYISRIQAYIIDNTGFTQGTRDDLIKLLEQKINMTRIKYSK